MSGVSQIEGVIDDFSFPAHIMGWVVSRRGEKIESGIRIEVCRGDMVIANASPTRPRPDVTGDPNILTGFSINCAGAATAEEFISGAVFVRALNQAGQCQVIPVWERTRDRISTELETRKATAASAPATPGQGKFQALKSASAAADIRQKAAVKIAFIGAGSTVFAKNLLGDILLRPELADSRICLYDIDAERLRVSEIVARRIAATLDIPASIETTTDLGQALDGADYAFNMIQVGGYQPCTVTDFEIPKRYGLRQTIADTLGIGGIMRALRTVPVLLDMVREMERRCPDVLHLNYVNPMAMNCWALSRASAIKTVGLCHSVQGTAAELARDLGLPAEEVTYRAAGINHMAFYLSLSHNGEDLYPRLRQMVTDRRVPDWNRVRFDLLSRFGFFVTESSEHFAEYVPWYIKRGREDLIRRYNVPLDEYPRRCTLQIAEWASLARTLTDPTAPLEIRRSNEYGVSIIHAIETGQPTVIYGNVLNTGLIDNLPEGCCVEVPCLVDGNGVQPMHVGALPPQLAALIQTNVNVQSLTVEAILTGKRDHIYHAAMLDPHTAAELELDQIRAMVDEMVAAHARWIPEGLLA